MTPLARWRILVAICCLAALLVGCIRQPGPAPGPAGPPPPYQPPAQFDHLSYRWSSRDGTDLSSPPVVATRAYFESKHIIERTTDAADGYPGFEHASTPDTRYTDDYSLARPKDLHEYGTQFYQLLRLEPTPVGYTATVRSYQYWADHRPDGSYWNRAGLATVEQIDLTTPTPPPTGAPPAAHGPRKAPLTDIFGGWTITRYQFIPDGPDNANIFDPDQIPAEVATWPGWRQESDQFVIDTPMYPTLDPYPGWPDASAS